MRKLNSRRSLQSPTQETETPYSPGTEPRYVDSDEDGMDERPDRRPKWTRPSTEFQRKLLAAVGRKYYRARYERTHVIEIEQAMMSLETGTASKYPTEWVDNCIAWAQGVRGQNQWVQLTGLITLINNPDRRHDFIAHWVYEHKQLVRNFE